MYRKNNSCIIMMYQCTFTMLKFLISQQMDEAFYFDEKLTDCTGCSNYLCYLDNPKGPIILF